MAIWIDLTHPMSEWKGGVVGIIRAELEIAKNIHKIDKNVRFFINKDMGFYEIEDNVISWLWESENIADDWVKYVKGSTPGKNEVDENSKMTTADVPRDRYNFFSNKYIEIKHTLKLVILHLPKLIRNITYLLFLLLKKIVKYLFLIKSKLLENWRMTNARFGNKINITSNNVIKDFPFKDGDIIFYCGFPVDGVLENFKFSILKNTLPKIKISYLIYDMVFLKKETSMLYMNKYKEIFKEYIMWLPVCCDFLFFGGRTAQNDTDTFFIENGILPVKGEAIKFGSEISNKKFSIKFKDIQKKHSIEDKYILSVGSIDAKKNYFTLYKAYTILLKKYEKDKIPQLIIVGGKFANSLIIDCLEKDPKISNKIMILRPTDEELDILYKNCLFTVLPTWYEGWSLTLPESLNYGKLCLASNVAPLREIAGDLIKYIDPMDVCDWAKNIYEVANSSSLIAEYEEKIKKEWVSTKWSEPAKNIYEGLNKLKELDTEKLGSSIFMDITLIYISCKFGASVSGILRTELILAKYLGLIFTHMRFIALLDDQYILIDRHTIEPLFTSQLSIDEIFKQITIRMRLDGYFYNDNVENHKNYVLPIKKNDLLISFGIGVTDKAYVSLENNKEKNKFKFIQLIYDFTPILYPQFHTAETREGYKKFLKNTFLLSDEIFYGGKTALEDGEQYAEEHGYELKKSFAVKFGSDNLGQKNTLIDDDDIDKIFKKYKINKEYIMTVGSLEPRKNHETLYLAYIEMMKKYQNIPQLVFCGFPGWNNDDFLQKLYNDERIKDKIIVITPTDMEKEILYKNCLFTVLPSIYEGWSLTLPESFNYGKFCLCTDNRPLREIANDLSEYIEGYDVMKWSERMYYYFSNKKALKEKENQIAEKWKSITWKDCSDQIVSEINNFLDKENNSKDL